MSVGSSVMICFQMLKSGPAGYCKAGRIILASQKKKETQRDHEPSPNLILVVDVARNEHPHLFHICSQSIGSSTSSCLSADTEHTASFLRWKALNNCSCIILKARGPGHMEGSSCLLCRSGTGKHWSSQRGDCPSFPLGSSVS